jgi:hypothetical protein
MEIEVTSCTVALSDTLVNFFIIVLMTLCSAGLLILVPKGGILLSGDTMIPLNWNLRCRYKYIHAYICTYIHTYLLIYVCISYTTSDILPSGDAFLEKPDCWFS